MIRFSSARPDYLSVGSEPRKEHDKEHTLGERRSAMRCGLQKKGIKKLSKSFGCRYLMRLKGLIPGTKSNDNRQKNTQKKKEFAEESNERLLGSEDPMMSQGIYDLTNLSNISTPSVDELCWGNLHDIPSTSKESICDGGPPSENVADGHVISCEETDLDETSDDTGDDTLKDEEMSQAKIANKKQKGRCFQLGAMKKLKWMRSPSN